MTTRLGYTMVPVALTDSDCSICLKTFDKKNKRYVKRLCCGHVFHKGCIDEWTNRGATTCPNCRHCFCDYNSSELREDVPLVRLRERLRAQHVGRRVLPTHYRDPLLWV